MCGDLPKIIQVEMDPGLRAQTLGFPSILLHLCLYPARIKDSLPFCLAGAANPRALGIRLWPDCRALFATESQMNCPCGPGLGSQSQGSDLSRVAPGVLGIWRLS